MPTPWRIVFMGTPQIAAATLEELVRGADPVVGVVTQPDRPSGRGQQTAPSPVRKAAEAHGVNVIAAEKIRTPFLMMHGSEDTTVRPSQSEQLKGILDKNKVPNERKVFEGKNHPIDQTNRDEVYALIRAWFTKNGVLTK